MTVEADKLFVPEETLRDGSGAIISQPPRPETPKTTQLIPDVSRSFSAIVQTAKDVLVNPDVAVRTDYRLADQMLHDPMVMAPLQKRLLATAQLPYEIVPENPSDQYQKDVCANLTRIVKRIPRLQELFRSLGMATFRGTGASEINWTSTDTSQYEIDNHRPYHGDKITYDIWGNPRILTRDYQTGGRQLDKGEKDRLIIHTFDREDGEFYDGAQAGYVFKGRGVRDVIWPYWFLKINATRFWVTLLERFGTGWVEGRYPAGNKQAKDAIESVLQNLVNDSKYSLPVPGSVDMDKGNYGITVHKLDGIGESAKLFTDFVEHWAGKHIRMVIEGQEQAQQEGGDGLGSGRATALADIFRMYRDYDAGLLSDTLTDQLLGKIVFFNYGHLRFRPIFRFITEKADYDEQMKRVQAAKEAGMRVPRRWLNETLDVPELTGEESPDEIIDFGAQQAGAMPAGKDAGDALFMEDHEPNAMREMFSEALTLQRYGFDPSEKRDDDGKWTGSGGGNNSSDKTAGNTSIKTVVDRPVKSKAKIFFYGKQSSAKMQTITAENIRKTLMVANEKYNTRIEEADIASLVGAPDDAEVTVLDSTPTTIKIYVKHKYFVAERKIVLGNDGVHIENQNMEVDENARGKGIGANVFSAQVASAKNAGISKIVTHAAREDSEKQDAFNGYYTWARFGYDQSLDNPLNFESIVKYEMAKRIFPDAKSVQDIMSTKSGRDWWKENGTGMHHAVFDLSEGSKSMQVLTAYNSARSG